MGSSMALYVLSIFVVMGILETLKVVLAWVVKESTTPLHAAAPPCVAVIGDPLCVAAPPQAMLISTQPLQANRLS